MNHAEHATKLLARYHDGQGSDQAAIAHALLAVNETLRDCFGERMPLISEEQGDVVQLVYLQERVNAALGLADEWTTSIRRVDLSEAGEQLREVLGNG